MNFTNYYQFISRRDLINKLPLLSHVYVPSIKGVQSTNSGVVKVLDPLILASSIAIIELLTFLTPLAKVKKTTVVEQGGKEVERISFSVQSPIVVSRYFLNYFFLNFFFMFNENWHTTSLENAIEYSADALAPVAQIHMGWWSGDSSLKLSLPLFRFKRFYKLWGGFHSHLIIRFRFFMPKRRMTPLDRRWNLIPLLFFSHIKLSPIKIIHKP
jgi:hypothetical protein